MENGNLLNLTMALAQKRQKFKKLETATGRILSNLPFSPNFYTLSSIALSFFALYFLIKSQLLMVLIFFVLAALLDFVDGAVARYCQKATKIGAYLDTICDRYVEGIILLGFLFLPLKKVGFSPEVWIFILFFGSILTTYSKAAAKEKGLLEKEFFGGIAGRAERIILVALTIALGLFSFTWMSWAIVFLAFLFNVAALSRIYLIMVQAKNHPIESSATL